MGNTSSKAANKVVRQFPKGKQLKNNMPNIESLGRNNPVARDEKAPIDDKNFMKNLSKLVEPKEKEENYRNDNINPNNPIMNILQNRLKVEEKDAIYDQPFIETKLASSATLKPHELEDLVVKGTLNPSQYTPLILSQKFNLKEDQVKMLLQSLKPCEKVKLQPENQA